MYTTKNISIESHQACQMTVYARPRSIDIELCRYISQSINYPHQAVRISRAEAQQPLCQR